MLRWFVEILLVRRNNIGYKVIWECIFKTQHVIKATIIKMGIVKFYKLILFIDINLSNILVTSLVGSVKIVYIERGDNNFIDIKVLYKST